MEKILLIGGPGTLSSACMDMLLAQGHEVGMYTHHLFSEPAREGVQVFQGERGDSRRLGQAIEAFKPAVVVDFICFRLEEAKALYPLLRACQSFARLLFISTCDVYGYPLYALPFSEDSRFSPPISAYAAEKLAIEQFYLTKQRLEDFPVAIARPSYSFGSRFLLNFFSREGGLDTFYRIQHGKPVVVMDTGMTLMHAGSGENTGRMIACIAGGNFSKGESFTCGHESPMTHRAYLRLFEEALGISAWIHPVPKPFVRLYAEQFPQKAGLVSELTGFDVSFTMDKFKAAFPDFTWNPLQQAMNAYLEEHQADLLQHKPSSIEDQLIEAFEQTNHR